MGAYTAPRALAALVLAASISSGCAPQTAPPRDNPSVEGLVLRIDTRGGFLPAAVALTRIPQFSLYGDGLIVMEGAQIAIYPGPALPAVFSMRVNGGGLGRIVEAARDAGLDGPDRNYDHPGVADAATTTFTFIENGRTHVISAYALGIEGPNSGIPESERKARAALLDLQTKVQTLQNWLPEGSLTAQEAFDYQKLAVIVSTEAVEDQLEQRELTWPLERSIADWAEPAGGAPVVSCFTVEGEDLVKLRPLVERANELTPWKDGGKTYWLRFRPLLSDESGCPEL